MKTTHHIILSSSYSLGKRICVDFYDNTDFNSAIKKIINKCGSDVSLSIHIIQTDSKDWKSVTKDNPFWTDVMKFDIVDKFIETIKKDRTLTALDVTKYIISKVQCTHLKLQKLLYLCYAQYLLNHNKKLFEGETICALPKGPIVSSICDRYGGQNNVVCEKSRDKIEINDTEQILGKKSMILPSRSRILFAEDGSMKVFSIDKTLETYNDMTANDLVNLTHKKDSPWSIVRNRNNGWGVIEDEDIFNYHKNEIE